MRVDISEKIWGEERGEALACSKLPLGREGGGEERASFEHTCAQAYFCTV